MTSASTFDYNALLSNWRHELRTPLNALIGYSEMLLEDTKEQESQEITQHLEAIHTAAKQMLASLNTLLDPLRIETTQLPFDLQNFSMTLCQELRTPLNVILASGQRLVKYAETSRQWEFSADFHKIMTAAENFTTLIDLIITTSESQAELRELSLDSTEKQSILKEALQSLAETEKTTRQEQKAGTLLVVDDNEMNRDVLSRHLERQGHRVLVAENGDEALEMLKTRTFDLMLLDIVMPEMNGYDVLQHLKQAGILFDLPVIMISALDEMDSVVRCIEMGAEDFLTKPFNPILLKARISACLEKKRLRELAVDHLQDLVRMSEEMAREKADFLRIMAHKLKSPVSAVKMMADLYTYYPAENPKIADISKKISVRMDQLLDLIKDLREFAKVKAGDPLGEITVFNLVEETQKGCEPYLLQAEEKGVNMKIECEEPSLRIRFDIQGFAMIISNLVENAVKHTQTGSVQVNLKRQDASAVLEVSDTGIGIPQAEISRLFTEFFHGSNVPQQMQGSGLGLAGVKDVIERFGAEIDVRSQENEGTIFTVRFPLYEG